MNKEQSETADAKADEAAVFSPREKATRAPKETRRVPRQREMPGAYSRAAPRAEPVRVIRSWPGVTNGQLVVLRPDREKRLLKAGLVERV